MSFANAQQARILLGVLNLSGYTTGVTSQSMTDMLEVTTINDTAKQFIPGLSGSNFSIPMILDAATTAGGQIDTTGSWKASAAQPITFGPFGLTASSLVQLVGSLETQLQTQAQNSGVVTCQVDGLSDGLFDQGIILDNTAVTIDGSTTGIDNTASSANGGVAHLHVTGFSGLTSDVIIIEHSVNNSVWTTLGTFTTVTGTTSQRLVVAAGTTVNRYLRVTDDVTGSGTCTRTVAFSRR